MNKQEAMKEIETIRARLEVLEGVVQEPGQCGLWKPKVGERYWYLSGGGSGAHTFLFSDDDADAEYIANGNCFPTREAAEKVAPLFARAHKIIQAALMVDPDAGEWTDNRMWTCAKQHEEFVAGRCTVTRSFDAYVHTEEQAARMAAILNAEGV